MNLKKILKDYGSRLALLAAAIALILFIPACLTDITGLRVFLIILIVLLLGGGGALLFFATKGQSGKLHYFLYDPRIGRSIAREALTEAIVQERTNAYLKGFERSALSLWEEIPDSLRTALSENSAYGPLVMYRMLAALAGCPDRHITMLFAKAAPDTVSYLCRTISENGDKELADYIFSLKKNASEGATNVAVFFKKNAARFSARALHCVQKNFDSYYFDKK